MAALFLGLVFPGWGGEEVRAPSLAPVIRRQISWDRLGRRIPLVVRDVVEGAVVVHQVERSDFAANVARVLKGGRRSASLSSGATSAEPRVVGFLRLNNAIVEHLARSGPQLGGIATASPQSGFPHSQSRKPAGARVGPRWNG